MRLVVALGGNALLRRGEPAEAETQRQNVLGPPPRWPRSPTEHELADHARQRTAGRPPGARSRRVQGRLPVPARRARRREPGDDRLPARPGAAQRARPRRDRRTDAGRRRLPTIPRSRARRSRSAPSTTKAEARRLSPSSAAGRSPPTVAYFRRVVASPEPRAIVELDLIERLVGRRRDRRLRRRRRHSGRRRRPQPARRRSRDRQGPHRRPPGRERPGRAARSC